jgi:hypothetical protein
MSYFIFLIGIIIVIIYIFFDQIKNNLNNIFNTNTNTNTNCSGTWLPWTDCSSNTGTKTRSFKVEQQSLNGGTSCPTTETIICPVDCSGTWLPWTDCSSNTGTKTRSFKVEQQSLNGGTSCPTTETILCPVDCSGTWLPWTDCSSNTGTKTRSFKVERQLLNGGSACPISPETQICPVDCNNLVYKEKIIDAYNLYTGSNIDLYDDEKNIGIKDIYTIDNNTCGIEIYVNAHIVNRNFIYSRIDKQKIKFEIPTNPESAKII